MSDGSGGAAGPPRIRWASAAAAEAARDAAVLVESARDRPDDRLRLAAEFYETPAGGRALRPYRRAEVAFMRWQIRRGVLAPPTAENRGSAWWRAVNEVLLRDATEARLRCDGDPAAACSTRVRLWLTFLRDPTPGGWYRAHNASIVAGYLEHRDLVAGESLLERFFMDVALVRVLYAHCLIARPRLALGRIAPLGPLLGDPRRRAADLFLSLQNILPATYPIADSTIDDVLADENYLGRVFDYGIIAPLVEQLYAFSAEELDEPRVLGLHDKDCPVYAWPAEYGHVWRSTRSRKGIAVIRALLGPAAAGGPVPS